MRISVTWHAPLRLPMPMSRLHERFDLDCLPDDAAIYLFARRFGLRMQVLYVGMATSLRGRIKQQLNNLKLMQTVDDVAIGPRMLIYGTFNTRPGQRVDVILDIVERALIDLFGLDALTNEVRGWRSLQLGRIPLPELTMYYAAKPVDVTVPALLIRINRLYRHNMTAQELYEATRGVWKVGPRCAKAQYAFAVFEGVVREVYEIDSWHDAATTPYATRDASQMTTKGRREFLRPVGEATIRDAYVGRSVAEEFRRGLRSSVVYVNC